MYEHYDGLIQFFTEHLHLTPKFFNGQLADRPVTSHSHWGDQDERMKAQGLEPHPLLGKCYHAVRFFQYLGGFDNFEAYTIYKKIPHKLRDEYTTHWFLKDNTDGTIIDPTVEQFDYINITDFYHLGQRASGSLCYYGFTPGIPLWDCFVPPVTTRKLTRAYKSQTGTAVAMEKWLVEEDWWKANKHHYKMRARQR